MSRSTTTTSELSARLVATCRERGLTLATCESLTAGLCAASIADTPGASAVLRGGLITYATDLKHSLADVDPVLLDRCGAVDPEVARAMASGARRACRSDLAAALTGVAGPAEQDGRAVGTVFIAIASATATTVTEFRFAGDRASIRAAAVRAALVNLLAAASTMPAS